MVFVLKLKQTNSAALRAVISVALNDAHAYHTYASLAKTRRYE